MFLSLSKVIGSIISNYKYLNLLMLSYCIIKVRNLIYTIICDGFLVKSSFKFIYWFQHYRVTSLGCEIFGLRLTDRAVTKSSPAKGNEQGQGVKHVVFQ